MRWIACMSDNTIEVLLNNNHEKRIYRIDRPKRACKIIENMDSYLAVKWLEKHGAKLLDRKILKEEK